jgi:polyisoprenoid-binding protein YceI
MNTTSTVQVPTETYSIDPLHTHIGFAVKYNGLSMFRSNFGAIEGGLEGGVLRGAVEVTSIGVGMDRFRGHLLSPDFFDAERYPKITFESREISLGEDGQATVSGELTLRGVSREVSAQGTYALGEDPMGNDRFGLSLQTTLDRREFGLTWQNPLPSGGDAVSWEVELTVEVQLVKPHA